MSIHVSRRTVQQLKRIQALLDQLDPEAEPQALIVPGSPVPHGTSIVFPGSFNPPTTAHLALMKQARDFVCFREWSKGEQVVAHLYAAISRHIVDKESVERPLLAERVMLLDTVLRHRLRHTGILLFNRGLYVEQADAVRAAFHKVTRLLFLVGFDKIVQILDPHYYDDRAAALHDLFARAELLVAPRGKDGPEALGELLKRPENRRFARFIHGLPFSSAYREISSTQVRQDPIAHVHDVPHEVWRFMQETHVYAPPRHLPDGSEVDSYGERMKLLQALLKDEKDEK